MILTYDPKVYSYSNGKGFAAATPINMSSSKVDHSVIIRSGKCGIISQDYPSVVRKRTYTELFDWELKESLMI